MKSPDYAAHPSAKRWCVRRRGSVRATYTYFDRETAWAEAQRLARRSGGTAWLHGLDGRVERRIPYR